MKRFFLKLLLFVLPLVACCAYFELKLSALPNTYSQKKLDFEKRVNETRILVLGPSHALHGIDPQYFSQPGFNLANASQTLFYDKALTLRYLDAMQQLKVVFITLNYNAFFTRLSDSKESFRCFFYSTYWHIDEPGLPKWDIRRYSKIALYTPEESVKFASDNFKVDLIKDLSPLGYLAYDTADDLKNISDLQGAKRVELYRRMMKNGYYDENVQYITDLIVALRSRGIFVYLLNTPVYSTFTKYCDPSIVQENKSTIMQLCKMYRCQYLDYSSDPRFTIRDFYDNDHLNNTGAVKFSKILNNDIIRSINFDR